MSLTDAFQMTGLDHNTDSILSISCFITDAQLNLLDDNGFDIVIHHDQARLSSMGEWCTRTHGESGLTKTATESTVTAEEAAQQLLAYIKSYVPSARTGLLAGNSIHADKMFLSKPPFNSILAHLHYRLLDVSAIKEAVRRWGSDEVLQSIPPKKGLHQAREDILESIEEARYYQRLIESLK